MPTMWRMPGRAAERLGIDGPQRLADGAGGARGFELADHEHAGLQRGGLGDAGGADLGLDDGGGIGEPVAFLIEFGDGEQPQRHA